MDDTLSLSKGEWKEYKLGEVGIVITGKTPSSQFPEEFGFEMPFVTPTDYKNYHKWADNAERFLSKVGIKKLNNKVLPPHSLLVTCIGSDMGKVVLNKVPVITNQQINSIIPFIDFDSNLLYYKLLDEYETLRVYGEAGTAVPILNKGDFENILVEIPTAKDEQQSIASILSSLDDKIDLLHRQNKTLEQLAETLFRQWFIEEKPQPSLSPSQGERNKKADENWEEVTVSDIIDVRDGTHDSPKQSLDGFYLITSRHMKSTGIDFSTAYKISEADYAEVNRRSKVDKNDILFSMIGTLGLIHLVTDDPDYAIKNIGLFKSSEKPWFTNFLYLLLKSPIGEKFIYESADGSTQEYITLRNLRNFKFQFPGENQIKEFNKIIESHFMKMKLNTIQIRTLTQLRDTLLPKLMSGEVRVKN